MARMRTFDPITARSTPPMASEPDRACAPPNVAPLFYPERKTAKAHAQAAKICHSCPHERSCLAWALETEQVFGVWGGKTPKERADILAEGQ